MDGIKKTIKREPIKVGDEVWVILSGEPVKDLRYKYSTGYSKPLGIFKTKVIKVEKEPFERPFHSNTTFYHFDVDDTSFKHLYRPDSIPDDKTIHEYLPKSKPLDFIFCFGYKDNYGYMYTQNVRFTEEEAQELYNRDLSYFKSDIKDIIKEYEKRVKKTKKSLETMKKSLELMKKSASILS